MTDFALPAVRTLDLASDAAKARVRARYRAEARFKFYGLAAIGLTAVVPARRAGGHRRSRATRRSGSTGCCSTSRSTGPRSTRRERAIRPSSAPAISRPWCATRCGRNFPDVSDRAGRRLLDGILSSGASDALRERVVADPSLVGQTVKVPVLISDDADLYYKGIGTRIERRPGRGILSPSGTPDEIAHAELVQRLRIRCHGREAGLVGAGAQPAQGGGRSAPDHSPARGAQGRARTRARAGAGVHVAAKRPCDI